MSRLSLRSPVRPATEPRPRWQGRIELPALPRPARLALVALGWLAAATALFFCYLHLSRTVPANSDGASNALQAWSMLHGNLLLHGWVLSDVSFYTTELPEYMLIELVHGLTPDDMHIAGALTYTLLVVLTAWVAKGRASGGEGLLRAALGAGIMVAPPMGSVYELMLQPDHVGSVIPVLLIAGVLDRAGRRSFVPVLVFLLVTWALVADQVILITAVLPLSLVSVVHGYRRGLAQWRPGGPIRLPAVRSGLAAPAWWFEVALLAAAVAAVIVAGRVVAFIREVGGYHVYPVNQKLSYFDALPHNVQVTIQGILVLFGANFAGKQVGVLAAIGVLHLLGAGLVLWAVCAALRRFGRLAISLQFLAASVCVTLVAYLLGPNALSAQSSREMAAVLPLGAALAGRMLASRLRRARLVPALAAVLAVYFGGLVFYSTRPAVPADNQALASWLASHRLRHGLTTDYWLANSTTVDSGGTVAVRAVQIAGAGLEPNLWEINRHWYRPPNVATFAVLPPWEPAPWRSSADGGALVHTFGRPLRAYSVAGYTVLVWHGNLLTRLGWQPRLWAGQPARGGRLAGPLNLIPRGIPMRRIAAAALAALAACAVVAGCGSSASSPNAAVTVSGSFGKTPTVTIPAEKASANLVVSTPISGSGATLKTGDSPLADVALYKWSGTKHSLLYSTFATGPQIIPAQLGLPGLSAALKDARLGSRVVAVLPPKYAYGTAGESQLGVSGTDTLVWVIDLLQQYSGTQSASGPQVSSGGRSGLPSVTTTAGRAPVITVPKSSPPAVLSVTTLIKGSGPKLSKGETVVAQYVGANWRTGSVFASSWPTSQQPAGQLFGFQLGGNVLAGWTKGLTGVQVGSRVMLVIPPSLGYGPAGGNASAGIQKNDTLVFVVDVIGSAKPV